MVAPTEYHITLHSELCTLHSSPLLLFLSRPLRFGIEKMRKMCYTVNKAFKKTLLLTISVTK